jgi:hypothetical protein
VRRDGGRSLRLHDNGARIYIREEQSRKGFESVPRCGSPRARQALLQADGAFGFVRSLLVKQTLVAYTNVIRPGLRLPELCLSRRSTVRPAPREAHRAAISQA